MALASWMLAEGPHVEERAVLLDGHRMYCLKTGNGPALVLLHGLLGYADVWYPCFSRLGEDSTVYAPDALGIGQSDRVPGIDPSLAAQADRIEQFLTGSGIEKADIVGTSHGGAVAMMLAARHPERVRSLVLHAPANPFSTISDPLVHFYRSPLGRWFAQQVPYLPEKLQELALGRMYGNSSMVRQHVLDSYMSSLRVPGTVEYIMSMVDRWFDDMRELGAVLAKWQALPTLLLWGTRDRAVSFESARALEKKLRAKIITLPGVGHLPYEEAPLAFAGIINGFLRKIERSEPQMGSRPGLHSGLHLRPQLVRRPHV